MLLTRGLPSGPLKSVAPLALHLTITLKIEHLTDFFAGYQGGAPAGNAEPLSRLQSIKSGMSGKQNITDLRSARGAIDDLLTELNTGKFLHLDKVFYKILPKFSTGLNLILNS